jgi:cyclic pyranopterin phosphate synthase
MIDQFGRTIDYMRVSITDRCNLRCRYCIPEGISLAHHDDILRYEEILHICDIAVSLGIKNFKITGGEPLVRKGCVDFIALLKRMTGVEQVTITTNGLLLPENLDALCAAGVDAVNISIDTLCDDKYKELTGYHGDVSSFMKNTLAECIKRGLKIKVNAVLLAHTYDGIFDMAALAEKLPIDVRFIELMPIGEAAGMAGIPMDDALRRLQQNWPDLQPTEEKRGNGPAHYYTAAGLKGRIGFIDAVSNRFCERCNRVRLTSTGFLNSCLCYEEGIDLKALLRNGCPDTAIRTTMEECIQHKPLAHCFDQKECVAYKTMNKIGG